MAAALRRSQDVNSDAVYRSGRWSHSIIGTVECFAREGYVVLVSRRSESVVSQVEGVGFRTIRK